MKNLAVNVQPLQQLFAEMMFRHYLDVFPKIFIFLHMFPIVTASPDTKRLLKDLFKGYDNVIMPKIRHDEVMNVTVRFIPRGITDFSEVAGQISVAMGVDIRWVDAYLSWSPKEYGGLTHIVLPEERVWIPHLSIANPSDRIPIFPEDPFSVRIFFNGQAILIKGGTVRCTCKPNLRYYPFDVHSCNVKFINLDHVFNEIQLNPELKLDVYENYGEWDLFDSVVDSNLFDLFSCAVYKFKIKRRPEFSILTVCIPILCLGLLNACVFLIPPECGERISYAITVLLSFAVFMTIVSTVMPKNTDPVPILCYVLTLMLAESGIIVAVSILGLRLYYKPEDQKVPEWLERLVTTFITFQTAPKPFSITNEIAENDERIIDKESNRFDKHIRWRHVGHAFDCLCFVVSFCSFSISVVIYAVIVMIS